MKGGHYVAKVVRMSDIAERLHVSTVTVSKALSGKDGVSDQLRQEIQQIAKEMGYHAKKQKNDMRKCYTFGIITSNRYIEQGQSFYWVLYERILYHLKQVGHLGVLEIVTETMESTLQMPQLVEDTRINGIIIMGNLDEKYRNALAITKTPLILLDAFDARFQRDSIISDGYYGMYTVVDYLLQMGHRDIMFVGTVNATNSITDRYYGYCRAMREAGIHTDSRMVLPDRDEFGKISLTLENISHMPTAFACNCDMTAYILLELLKQKGIRIPEEVSLVGFDNYTISELSVPGLTTYAVDLEHMAKICTQLLIRRIQKPNASIQRVVVSGSLVIRNSVKAI